MVSNDACECLRMVMERFPSARRYLDALPAGLDSFPDLRVHTEALGLVREIVPGPYDDVPGALGAYFRYEIDDAWVPEVLGQCTTLMLCDTIGEAALISRSRELAQRLYSGRVLRHLIRLLSPTLLIMGTQRRWAVLRRGTEMTSTPTKKVDGYNRGEIVVSAPHPVFTATFGRALQPVIEVAVESANGKDPSVEIAENTPTRMRFVGHWRS